MSKLTDIEKRALMRLRRRANQNWKEFRSNYPDPGQVTDELDKEEISYASCEHSAVMTTLRMVEVELKALHEETQPAHQ